MNTRMKIEEIAHGIVEMCRQDHFERALDTYYASDAESVEPSGESRVTKGLDAIRAKGEWWRQNFEVHSLSVEGPFLHGDEAFVIRFTVDMTFKPTGVRSHQDELGLYLVRDGKVFREQFFTGNVT